MQDEKKISALTMAGNIDRRTFMRFGVFDSVIRKKAWRNPLLFTLILTAFAVVCFLGREGREEAVMIGSVLLGIGIVLPLVWFGSFLASMNRQAKLSSLSHDRVQYYVTLLPDGFKVEKGKESASYTWNDVYMAYRFPECIYLYGSAARAFLLPECEKSDRAWEIITAHLPAEKRKLRVH